MGLRGPKKGWTKKLKQGEKTSVTVRQEEPDFKLKEGQIMVQKEKKDEPEEQSIPIEEEELPFGVRKVWNGKEWIKYDHSLITLSGGVITKYFFEGKEVWIDRSKQVQTPISKEGLLR